LYFDPTEYLSFDPTGFETYLHTYLLYLLTPWTRVLLEKLTGPKIVN